MKKFRIVLALCLCSLLFVGCSTTWRNENLPSGKTMKVTDLKEHQGKIMGPFRNGDFPDISWKPQLLEACKLAPQEIKMPQSLRNILHSKAEYPESLPAYAKLFKFHQFKNSYIAILYDKDSQYNIGWGFTIISFTMTDPLEMQDYSSCKIEDFTGTSGASIPYLPMVPIAFPHEKNKYAVLEIEFPQCEPLYVQMSLQFRTVHFGKLLLPANKSVRIVLIDVDQNRIYDDKDFYWISQYGQGIIGGGRLKEPFFINGKTYYLRKIDNFPPKRIWVRRVEEKVINTDK